MCGEWCSVRAVRTEHQTQTPSALCEARWMTPPLDGVCLHRCVPGRTVRSHTSDDHNTPVPAPDRCAGRITGGDDQRRAGGFAVGDWAARRDGADAATQAIAETVHYQCSVSCGESGRGDQLRLSIV